MIKVTCRFNFEPTFLVFFKIVKNCTTSCFYINNLISWIVGMWAWLNSLDFMSIFILTNWWISCLEIPSLILFWWVKLILSLLRIALVKFNHLLLSVLIIVHYYRFLMWVRVTRCCHWTRILFYWGSLLLSLIKICLTLQWATFLLPCELVICIARFFFTNNRFL